MLLPYLLRGMPELGNSGVGLAIQPLPDRGLGNPGGLGPRPPIRPVRAGA